MSTPNNQLPNNNNGSSWGFGALFAVTNSLATAFGISAAEDQKKIAEEQATVEAWDAPPPDDNMGARPAEPPSYAAATGNVDPDNQVQDSGIERRAPIMGDGARARITELENQHRLAVVEGYFSEKMRGDVTIESEAQIEADAFLLGTVATRSSSLVAQQPTPGRTSVVITPATLAERKALADNPSSSVSASTSSMSSASVRRPSSATQSLAPTSTSTSALSTAPARRPSYAPQVAPVVPKIQRDETPDQKRARLERIRQQEAEEAAAKAADARKPKK